MPLRPCGSPALAALIWFSATAFPHRLHSTKCIKDTADNGHSESWGERKYRELTLHRIAFSRNRVKDAGTREASKSTLSTMKGRLLEKSSSGMQVSSAIDGCGIGSMGKVLGMFLVAVAPPD